MAAIPIKMTVAGYIISLPPLLLDRFLGRFGQSRFVAGEGAMVSYLVPINDGADLYAWANRIRPEAVRWRREAERPDLERWLRWFEEKAARGHFYERGHFECLSRGVERYPDLYPRFARAAIAAREKSVKMDRFRRTYPLSEAPPRDRPFRHSEKRIVVYFATGNLHKRGDIEVADFYYRFAHPHEVAIFEWDQMQGFSKETTAAANDDELTILRYRFAANGDNTVVQSIDGVVLFDRTGGRGRGDQFIISEDAAWYCIANATPDDDEGLNNAPGMIAWRMPDHSIDVAHLKAMSEGNFRWRSDILGGELQAAG